MRIVVWAAVVAGLAGMSWGQGPGEIQVHSRPYLFLPVIVADANTVPVSIVVRDRSGKVIANLKQPNFEISDNGQPQTIATFQAVTAHARAAPAGTAPAPASSAGAAAAGPRYVALLFDDVNSDKNDLAEARNGAVRFLREQLGPGDRMAVFTTSNTQSLEFTSDRDALSKAIALIAPHPRQSATGLAPCPRMTGYDSYLIAVLHDQGALLAKNEEAKACSGTPNQDTSVRDQIALNACGLKCTFGMPPPVGSEGVPIETLAEANWELIRGVSSDTLAAVGDVVGYTARQPGQRIVVLASSGFFSETLDNEKDRIIREALRDGVVINALDAKGLYSDELEPPLSEQSDMGVLPLAALIFDEGVRFPMREAQADAMASFAEATGGLYFKDNNDLTLGFQRLGLAPEAGYDLSFTPTPLVRDGKLHTLKYELVPGIPGATVEARRGYFAPLPGPTADEIERDLYEAMRGTAVRSALPVEAKVGAGPGGLAVRVHFGVSQANEKLALVAGLFDASGQYLTGERGDVVLALKDASLKKLRRSGLAPVFQLRAAAGKYRLRVVVEDETSGALTEISQAVQVQ